MWIRGATPAARLPGFGSTLGCFACQTAYSRQMGMWPHEMDEGGLALHASNHVLPTRDPFLTMRASVRQRAYAIKEGPNRNRPYSHSVRRGTEGEWAGRLTPNPGDDVEGALHDVIHFLDHNVGLG